MKNAFFSKILVVIFLFVGLSASAQVRVKKNTRNNNKIVVKKKRLNHYNRGGVTVKTNRNRVVINKPNRPRVIVKKPTYNKPGYVWSQGYWEWNSFYGRYTWKQARWRKIKKNHYWVPGFWEITTGGFFWIAGYWELEY